MELPAFPAVGVVRRILNSPSGAVCWVAITVWFKWNLVPISNEFSWVQSRWGASYSAALGLIVAFEA